MPDPCGIGPGMGDDLGVVLISCGDRLRQKPSPREESEFSGHLLWLISRAPVPPNALPIQFLRDGLGWFLTGSIALLGATLGLGASISAPEADCSVVGGLGLERVKQRAPGPPWMLQ